MMKAVQVCKTHVTTHSTTQCHSPENLNISSFITVYDHLLNNSVKCLLYVHFTAAEEEEQGEEVEEATSDQEFNTG
jgi:hypothetical protein